MMDVRARVLLEAAAEMIEKIKEDECATVIYDEAECDSICLIADIRAYLEE